MFEASFSLDGISIQIKIDGPDISITCGDAENIHLSPINAQLFASAIFAAVNEIENEA